MVQILQIAWVLEAACKVHYEAVKSQKEDWGRGVLVYSRQLWKVRSGFKSEKRTTLRVEVGLRKVLKSSAHPCC